MARDKLDSSVVCDLKLKLISDRKTDGRLYNLPNASEVAALIVGDEHTTNNRDIIIEKQTGMLQRINELHPAYLPLQYPLLYPHGEDGYRPNILHNIIRIAMLQRGTKLPCVSIFVTGCNQGIMKHKQYFIQEDCFTNGLLMGIV